MIKILYPSTKEAGEEFDSVTIAAVWARTNKSGGPLCLEALDCCGKLMLWDEYGNRNSEYGWEIDHIFPREKGGKSILENLQPLNWKTNEEKSDTFPWKPLAGKRQKNGTP